MYDLGNRQWDIPALRTLLEEVLPHDTAFDDFEVVHEFETVGPEGHAAQRPPHLPGGDHTEFILLAIEDMTERRRLEGQRR